MKLKLTKRGTTAAVAVAAFAALHGGGDTAAAVRVSKRAAGRLSKSTPAVATQTATTA